MTYVQFTKRTNDPKLAFLEDTLRQFGIPSRRNGESFHAPILEVPEECLDRANNILDSKVNLRGETVSLDDIEDDDPVFQHRDTDRLASFRWAAKEETDDQ